MSPHEILTQASWAIGRFVPSPHNKNPNQPCRMLEIGCAWGIYGMLMRNFFEAWFGRFKKQDYISTIDAIEASEIELSPFADQIYDNIIIGDALDVLPTMEDNSYDVVYAVEVLEHIQKERGLEFIEHCTRVARRGVVLSTPHPDCWNEQKVVHGNEYERHVSIWPPEELAEMGWTIMDNKPSYVAYYELMPAVGIGVVTFNRLDLLEKCYPTWRLANTVLAIFDNGSEPATVEWLRAQKPGKLIEADQNYGNPYGRNRLIEYFRDHHPEIEYLLLPDSDVELLPGALEAMVSVAQVNGDAGFVAFPQANKGFPVSPEGWVEEVAQECNLSRMAMWKEIGLHPESVMYYSSDSWKSTIANMHGWKTRLVLDAGEGYIHHQHGSQGNPGVKEQAERDVELWSQKDALFAEYWRLRLDKGKGNQYG